MRRRPQPSTPFRRHGGTMAGRSTSTRRTWMDDQDVISRINELADEEHALFQKESSGAGSEQDRERLNDLGVSLDQCWDLLHQRRARRSAGLDPDDARVRDEGTVEGYVN